MNELTNKKAGLQDDHDPRDLDQKQNDKPKGDLKPPKQRSDRTIATRRTARIVRTAT
jgi:hypothetical protein